MFGFCTISQFGGIARLSVESSGYRELNLRRLPALDSLRLGGSQCFQFPQKDGICLCPAKLLLGHQEAGPDPALSPIAGVPLFTLAQTHSTIEEGVSALS